VNLSDGQDSRAMALLCRRWQLQDHEGESNWYVCVRCTHTVVPDDPGYRCKCPKCTQVYLLGPKLKRPSRTAMGHQASSLGTVRKSPRGSDWASESSRFLPGSEWPRSPPPSSASPRTVLSRLSRSPDHIRCHAYGECTMCIEFAGKPVCPLWNPRNSVDVGDGSPNKSLVRACQQGLS
jgi:hypothetical protein